MTTRTSPSMRKLAGLRCHLLNASHTKITQFCGSAETFTDIIQRTYSAVLASNEAYFHRSDHWCTHNSTEETPTLTR